MPPEDELSALRRRVDDLEMQVAFQERTISRLDEVLREFARRVERAETALAALQGRVEDSDAPDPQ